MGVQYARGRAAHRASVNIDGALPPRGSGVARSRPRLGNRATRALLNGAHEEDEKLSIARSGFLGSSESLPHRAVIQRSFGRYAIGNVPAHVGGAARDASAALGAKGYALDGRVAFPRTPSLHTAAHEAAHVVQRRLGGARGERGERHADAVAAQVVAGRDAAPLLDATPRGAMPNGSPSLQLQPEPDEDQKAVQAARGGVQGAAEAAQLFVARLLASQVVQRAVEQGQTAAWVAAARDSVHAAVDAASERVDVVGHARNGVHAALDTAGIASHVVAQAAAIARGATVAELLPWEAGTELWIDVLDAELRLEVLEREAGEVQLALHEVAPALRALPDGERWLDEMVEMVVTEVNGPEPEEPSLADRLARSATEGLVRRALDTSVGLTFKNGTSPGVIEIYVVGELVQRFTVERTGAGALRILVPHEEDESPFLEAVELRHTSGPSFASIPEFAGLEPIAIERFDADTPVWFPPAFPGTSSGLGFQLRALTLAHVEHVLGWINAFREAKGQSLLELDDLVAGSDGLLSEVVRQADDFLGDSVGLRIRIFDDALQITPSVDGFLRVPFSWGTVELGGFTSLPFLIDTATPDLSSVELDSGARLAYTTPLDRWFPGRLRAELGFHASMGGMDATLFAMNAIANYAILRGTDWESFGDASVWGPLLGAFLAQNAFPLIYLGLSDETRWGVASSLAWEFARSLDDQLAWQLFFRARSEEDLGSNVHGGLLTHLRGSGYWPAFTFGVGLTGGELPWMLEADVPSPGEVTGLFTDIGLLFNIADVVQLDVGVDLVWDVTDFSNFFWNPRGSLLFSF